MKINLKKLILSFLLVPCALFAKNGGQVEDQPQVLEKAMSLDAFGALKEKRNGYLYLDLPNEYISELLPLINCPGQMIPPPHFESKQGIGAHISVIDTDERIKHDIWEIDEIGQTFNFEIKEVRSTKIKWRKITKKIWVLTFNSPQLEELRESYGLSSTPKGYDFYLLIGQQIPSTQNDEVEEDYDEQWFVEETHLGNRP
ncbi:MAG: hypothetical protein WAM28_00290 [Chlamydiales bacterium]